MDDATHQSASTSMLEAVRDAAGQRRDYADHVLKMLGYLDAGRALVPVYELARITQRLGEAVRGVDRPPEALRDHAFKLAEACEGFSREFGEQERGLILPHIGWGQVVDRGDTLRHHYGFTGTDSFRLYTELLAYLVRACEALGEVYLAGLAAVRAAVRSDPTLEALGEEARTALEAANAECHGLRDSLQAAARIVADIADGTNSFQERRERAAHRAESESNATVADLLKAISSVRSFRAWIETSPEARIERLEVGAGFRLRLVFADGTEQELVFDDDCWSFTGREMDLEQFRAVRLEPSTNTVIWESGLQLSGDGLYMSIKEGRIRDGRLASFWG